jgi:hypothetical protein
MRFPKPRQREVRSKTIIMTGGLNEVVTNLELKEGELHQVLNYMELDGPYHGYASINGYEAYDGTAAPSTIPALTLVDEGNDDLTNLLIESPNYVDIAQYSHTVINAGAVPDTVNLKFGPASFQFPQITWMEIPSVDIGPFSFSTFSSAYSYTPGTITRINLSYDWNVDFQVAPLPKTNKQILFEKAGCYKCELSATNILHFYISSDGISYDYVISTVDSVNQSLFSHVSISCKDGVLRLAINGVPVESGGETLVVNIPEVFQSASSLFLGKGTTELGSEFSGRLDEFRLSNTYRWVQAFDAPLLRYSSVGYSYVTWDDEDREATRAGIEECPGSGSILGLHIYKNQVYALRNSSDGFSAAMWVASDTGWTFIDGTFNPNGRLDADNWRFSGSYAGQQVMLIVDGASVPRVWDGDTMHVLSAPLASGLPDLLAIPRFAKVSAVFDNRWVLGYEADDIFLSSKTSPEDFSGGYGDQLLIGDDIQNMEGLPGEALAIICRNSTQVLEKLEVPSSAAATPDYTFRMSAFSREAGGIRDTAERMLGTLMYADDRGIINMTQSDKYADFEQSAISKKVNRIYLAKRHLIAFSLAERSLNQYRIYFTDGTGLIFTFLDEKLKGATFVNYSMPMTVGCDGEDELGDIIKYVGGTDGFVYQIDIGTSFNGDVIPTGLYTSYYGYASARKWKQFMRMIFELTAQRGTEFKVRPVFDYNDASFPITRWWEEDIKGLGGSWGKDDWGSFSWGGSVVQRMIHYTRGHGTNMSIEMITNSKYVEQHIVHNVIVDYQMENIQE